MRAISVSPKREIAVVAQNSKPLRPVISLEPAVRFATVDDAACYHRPTVCGATPVHMVNSEKLNCCLTTALTYAAVAVKHFAFKILACTFNVLAPSIGAHFTGASSGSGRSRAVSACSLRNVAFPSRISYIAATLAGLEPWPGFFSALTASHYPPPYYSTVSCAVSHLAGQVRPLPEWKEDE